MTEIYNDIQPVVQKLSEVFCISAEYLEEHLIEFVLEYGKYYLATDLVIGIGIILFITVVVAAIAIMVYKKSTKSVITSASIFFISISIILSMLVSIPYFASPTMYSIQAVMRLIG